MHLPPWRWQPQAPGFLNGSSLLGLAATPAADTRPSPAPLRITVVMDTGAGSRGLYRARRIVERWLEQALSPRDRVAVWTNDTVNGAVVADGAPGDEAIGEVLARAIEHAPVDGHLFEAVAAAAEERPNALLVLTPRTIVLGEDSRGTSEAAAPRPAAATTTVYVLQVRSGPVAEVGVPADVPGDVAIGAQPAVGSRSPALGHCSPPCG